MIEIQNSKLEEGDTEYSQSHLGHWVLEFEY